LGLLEGAFRELDIMMANNAGRKEKPAFKINTSAKGAQKK
jgi:hypothetical protein